MRAPAGNSPTPILDLESPLPSKKLDWDRLTWRQAILIVVTPIVMMALVIPATVMLSDNNPGIAKTSNYIRKMFDDIFDFGPQQSLPLIIVFYFFAIILFLLIHELGHLAGGIAVGFEFGRITIGPVTLGKSNGHLRLAFKRPLNINGKVVMKIRPIRRTRQRMTIFVAAAPLATLFSVACAMLILANPVSIAQAPMLQRTLEFFVVFSLFVVAVNLVPFRRSNGMPSDGARLLSLARSKAETKRFIYFQALKMQAEDGVRLRNFKQTWIAGACAVEDQSFDGLGAFWIAYLVSNDRDEAEKAAGYLEKCLLRSGNAPVEFKKLLLMEAAIFQAWFRNDQQKARIWQQKAEALATKAPPLYQFRLAICMHFVEHRDDDVESAWERGRHYIEGLPTSDANRRLLNIWLEFKSQLPEKRAARDCATKPCHNILQPRL